jgi:hypothetical protein
MVLERLGLDAREFLRLDVIKEKKGEIRREWSYAKMWHKEDT